MERLTKLGQLKGLELKRIIYPLVSIIIMLITLVVFVQAARFLSTHINKPYTIDQTVTEADFLNINAQNFQRVLRRLGHNPEQFTSAVAISEPERKNSLKISLYNATTTTSLANSLRDVLVNSGFAITRVDSVSPTVTTTTIAIKEAISQQFPESVAELKKIVGDIYPDATTTVLVGNSQHDIEITIFKKTEEVEEISPAPEEEATAEESSTTEPN